MKNVIEKIAGNSGKLVGVIGLLILGACSKAEFKGTNRNNAEAKPPVVEPTPVPTSTPTPTPSPVACTDKQFSIGAHVAFLIDNSNSNTATDCPKGMKVGTFRGTDLYECQEATNREKAVLAAFDVLAEVAAKEPDSANAKSSLSVVSFPSDANFVDGWAIKSNNGWLNASPADRSAIEKSLVFTRRPMGLTPYGAAMSAGNSLFENIGDTNKAKIAVLVTDGEPTDRDAVLVSEKADALRAKGVKVFTVYVTNGQDRAKRISDHTAMLRSFNDRSIADGKGPWYAQRYPSFDEYTRDLLGQGASLSLVEKVSSKTDSACEDKTGSRCERRIVEVENSTALTSVFRSIVNSAVRCE